MLYNGDGLCDFFRVRSTKKGIINIDKGTFVTRVKILTLSVLLCVVGNRAILHGQDGTRQKTLHEAAQDGDVEQLKQHIAKGANINEVNAGGWTPLRSTIEYSHTEAAKVLIEAGANLKEKDEMGVTPLIRASLRGQKEVVELLLAKGANPNDKDNAGRVGLHVATEMGHYEIVEALIKGKADVNVQDSRGLVPLAVARQRGMTEIADLLVKNGAKEPAPLSMDAYGYGPMGDQMMQQPQPGAGVYGAPQAAAPAVRVDPNEVKTMLKKFGDLAPALAELEKKSESEQRAWIQRRIDNRTSLVKAVDKQFEDEMVVVKKTAGEEKAEKTAKAAEDVVAKRKKRAEVIGDALGDQRREMLQSQTQGQGMDQYGRGGRSRTATRTGRGQTGMTGGDPYNMYGTTPTRMPARRTAADANEPVIDQETQAQMQAWLNAKAEDKRSLLNAVYGQDLADLGALEQMTAEEKQAEKTRAVLMALMLARQERIEKIQQKWLEEDERMMRLQQRQGQTGTPGMPGMPQDQMGGRRGTRRR